MKKRKFWGLFILSLIILYATTLVAGILLLINNIIGVGLLILAFAQLFAREGALKV